MGIFRNQQVVKIPNLAEREQRFTEFFDTHEYLGPMSPVDENGFVIVPSEPDDPNDEVYKADPEDSVAFKSLSQCDQRAELERRFGLRPR